MSWSQGWESSAGAQPFSSAGGCHNLGMPTQRILCCHLHQLPGAPLMATKHCSEALQIKAACFIARAEAAALQKSFLSGPRYPKVLYNSTFRTCRLGFCHRDSAHRASCSASYDSSMAIKNHCTLKMCLTYLQRVKWELSLGFWWITKERAQGQVMLHKPEQTMGQ